MTLPYKYGVTKTPANVTPISQMILSAFPLEFPVGNSDLSKLCLNSSVMLVSLDPGEAGRAQAVPFGAPPPWR